MNLKDLITSYLRNIVGGEYGNFSLPTSMPSGFAEAASNLTGRGRGDSGRGGTYQNIDPAPVIEN